MDPGLEDQFEDIVGKAAKGLGLGAGQLAERAGLDRETVRAALRGVADGGTARKLAAALDLAAEPLVGSLEKSWSPQVPTVYGVACFTTHYTPEWTVNAWVVFDPDSRDAAVFDTGTDASELLAFIADEDLRVGAIYLTHAHGDHVKELGRLIDSTGAPAFTGDKETVPRAEAFAAGRWFAIGSLEVGTRLTPGHSPGGITYVVDGLERPVVVGGDTVFAGSMGGGRIDYAAQLRGCREAILSLPDESLICPGHGPATTVAQEKRHNPFFAG